MTLCVRRFDSVSIGQPTRTAQGFLRIPARISKVGVLEYPQPDGKVWRELVTEDALFAQDCMDSAAGAPVTDLHPLEAVTPQNSREHTRGHVGEHLTKDGEDGLGAVLTITDADLIADIESGAKREVSMGYFATLDRTPGSYKGVRYDAKQVSRVYNHAAVVPQGRAGHSVRLKMDSATLELIEQEPLMKFHIDGVGEVEMTEAQVAAYKAKQTAAPQVDAAAVAAQATALAQAQARADQAAAELKKFQDAEAAKNTDAAKAADEKARLDAIAAQVALIAQATKFVKSEDVAGLAKLDAAGVMTAAILATDPEAKLDGKDASYLQARFDLLVEKGVQKTDATAIGNAILNGRSDAAGAEVKEVQIDELYGKPSQGLRSDAMRDEQHRRLENRWRNKPAATAAR